LQRPRRLPQAGRQQLCSGWLAAAQAACQEAGSRRCGNQQLSARGRGASRLPASCQAPHPVCVDGLQQQLHLSAARLVHQHHTKLTLRGRGVGGQGFRVAGPGLMVQHLGYGIDDTSQVLPRSAPKDTPTCAPGTIWCPPTCSSCSRAASLPACHSSSSWCLGSTTYSAAGACWAALLLLPPAARAWLPCPAPLRMGCLAAAGGKGRATGWHESN
jgi:hypothetical protein